MTRDAVKHGEDWERDGFAKVVLERLGGEKFALFIVSAVLKAFFELEREGTYLEKPKA